ncbi:A/G-specific adenine glycosylase [Candidatus Avelusimicrobium fimicolum]|uniref:A/G-specific adenine glycosylase n=1 Tax=Candidatus Avelusimicrobium fimicolum TaxID=3416216 RepID=UPI003D13CD68
MHFAKTLLIWYRQNKRDLPWRHTRDPYLIWLSEIILQQTRVAQGLSYYMRFTERFPTPAALAEADEDEVLKYWQGLGYYSRARNLHAAAKSMQGVFPSTYEGVRALKGVGDYTAAAICSFAYKMPYAVLDGNVYRVLARIFEIQTPIDSPAGKKEFSALAQKLLDKTHPDDYNQAIMDFGATVCTPVSPQCLLCPLADRCQAHLHGRVENFPVKQQKTKVSSRYFHYIYIEQGEDTWLHRRGAGDIWQNLYEPPLLETSTEADELPKVAWLKKPELLAEPVKHVLSHRVIYADLRKVTLPPSFPVPENFIRVPAKDVKKYAVSRLVQKLLEKAGLL